MSKRNHLRGAAPAAPTPNQTYLPTAAADSQPLMLADDPTESGAEDGTPGVASQVILALETCWSGLQSRHSEIPEAVIIIGGQQGRRSFLLYGHYAPKRWQRESERLPEILITGEGMKRGAEAVMSTLVHEAGHAVAGVRGVRDTSRGGRYHNRRFRAIGEELGLEVAFDQSIGWSPSTLSEASRVNYAAELELLRKELRIYRPIRLGTVPPPPPRKKLVCECGCGRQIRIAAVILDRGPITCGLCDGAFALRQAPA